MWNRTSYPRPRKSVGGRVDMGTMARTGEGEMSEEMGGGGRCGGRGGVRLEGISPQASSSLGVGLRVPTLLPVANT